MKKEVELGRVWHILSLISKMPSEEPDFFLSAKKWPLFKNLLWRTISSARESVFSSVKQHSWCIRARNKGLRTGAVNYELTLNYDLWTIPFSVLCGWLNLYGFWEKVRREHCFFLNRWFCFEDWNCVQVWEILTCQSSFWFGLWWKQMAIFLGWGLSSLMPEGCMSLAPGFLNLSSNGTRGMRLGRGQ